QYEPDQDVTPPSYHPTPPVVGAVPTQETGVRPSRRLGYRFEVGFDAAAHTLNLAIKNRGKLGVGLQARSLTVPRAPDSYTIGAGDELDVALPNPGTYDLSLHGPNGFFRRFAGSPASALEVNARGDHGAGTLFLRIANTGGRRRQPVVVHVNDAYGR